EIDPLLLGKAPLLRRDEDRAVEEWEESGGDLIAHPFPPASRIEQADSQRQAAGNLDDLAVLVHGGPPQEGVCLLLRDPLRTHEYSLARSMSLRSSSALRASSSSRAMRE